MFTKYEMATFFSSLFAGACAGALCCYVFAPLLPVHLVIMGSLLATLMIAKWTLMFVLNVIGAPLKLSVIELVVPLCLSYPLGWLVVVLHWCSVNANVPVV